MTDDKNSGGKGEPFIETLLSATGDVPLGISVEHETEGMVREVLKKGFPFESLDGCSERQRSAPSRTREDFALVAAISCITAGAVFLNVARAAGEGNDWGMMSEYTVNYSRMNPRASCLNGAASDTWMSYAPRGSRRAPGRTAPARYPRG